MEKRRFKFEITAQSGTSRARAGVITTPRGTIETPIFMPVGTLASVKSISPDELKAAGARIILGNAYHLYLKPGCEIIDLFSGLHRFMNWDRPILTDSGGFQIFSLAKLAKITENGVRFQSHIDGSAHELTPESVVEIQQRLDSDIMMCLDQCVKYPADREETEAAMELTHRWAARCRDKWKETGRDSGGRLFGIVQGGMFTDLRRRSVSAITALDFPGHAIGGLSVGEPKEMMLKIADFTLPILPDDKPKYIMGVGTPEDLVDLVGMGADMFDCVMPSRNARNGKLFTQWGDINIRNAAHSHDTNPVDDQCECQSCQNYSRAYIRHLFISRELLGYRLATIHNIHYYISLMKQMRAAIIDDSFDEFKKTFYQRRKKEPIDF